MDPSLEIIVPVGGSGRGLLQTIGSLVMQTDQGFGVILAGNFGQTASGEIAEAERQLTLARIAVRSMRPPLELSRIELWNWAHTQAQADWLKLLLPGEELKSAYVQRLRECIHGRAGAMVVRCDSTVETEWGVRTSKAPFDHEAITPAEFLYQFPMQIDWIARSTNLAYRRAAWQAVGGYAPHFPEYSPLNFNVILSLHHGLVNLGEALVVGNSEDLNSSADARQPLNSLVELWLILRQVRNYCLAAKLPGSSRWSFPAAMMATLRGS